MKTEEFERKIKNRKYIKIITPALTFYEKTDTIKIVYNLDDRYTSKGEFMYKDSNNNYCLSKQNEGHVDIATIKKIIPLTERKWKAIKLLCII